MSDKSRRKILKSIAAGSGAVIAGKSLPEKWTKPAVDSVLLPAHAQTSMGFFCESTGAPFADHVAPGPDVDITGGPVLLPWMVAVVPAPAPGSMINARLYFNGELLQNIDFALDPDGTLNLTGISGITPGELEFRFTWQPYDECSLFWNLISSNPPPIGGSLPSLTT